MEPHFDKTENTGLKHLTNATRFSLNGLVQAFKRESAFRQELALVVLLTPAAIWLADTFLAFIALMAVNLLVLIVELLNSGIEATVDRTGVEYHEMAGLAKDYGSAAVMLSLLVAGSVWAAFLVERFT